MEKKLDCKGMACPLPVVTTKKAMEELTEDGIVEVTVDNETAVQNLLKLAAKSNFAAASEKKSDEEFVVRKSYDVMACLREHLSDKVTFLGPTPKPIARTHNLYHYQIIIKYRFEDNLEETLNRVLDMTQEPENKDLRLIIDHEPQNFT